MAAGIGKKTTDLPLFVILCLTSQKNFWHSAISQDSATFWLGVKMLGIEDVNWALPSLRLRLRAALRHLLTLNFPPSLKVVMSLELAMPHLIPGYSALSDKMGVNSHSLRSVDQRSTLVSE